ncbi:MAG TPA: hypothetical protein VL481_00485 [Verrucomicrobiae bacterium]|jgi:hypothetical protein|nr:hypothetical protein [Verrucomicrobiae bacterium]
MALIIHIIIALTSIGFTTLLFIVPSKTKFNVNYALIALTLASGTYLVVSTNAPMLKSCMSGLLYISVVTLGTIAARYKYARQQTAL